jgi:hypothetical protein
LNVENKLENFVKNRDRLSTQSQSAVSRRHTFHYPKKNSLPLGKTPIPMSWPIDKPKPSTPSYKISVAKANRYGASAGKVK